MALRGVMVVSHGLWWLLRTTYHYRLGHFNAYLSTVSRHTPAYIPWIQHMSRSCRAHVPCQDHTSLSQLCYETTRFRSRKLKKPAAYLRIIEMLPESKEQPHSCAVCAMCAVLVCPGHHLTHSTRCNAASLTRYALGSGRQAASHGRLAAHESLRRPRAAHPCSHSRRTAPNNRHAPQGVCVLATLVVCPELTTRTTKRARVAA